MGLKIVVIGNREHFDKCYSELVELLSASQGTGYREQGTGNREQGTGTRFWATLLFVLPITHYPLPITNYPLPITINLNHFREQKLKPF
ncbi:MAG: hypothetical protein ACK50H_00255 [Dolichospermum sp.]